MRCESVECDSISIDEHRIIEGPGPGLGDISLLLRPSSSPRAIYLHSARAASGPCVGGLLRTGRRPRAAHRGAIGQAVRQRVRFKSASS
eukprot:scaffold27781_cov146-Isochrysis_galbana.AAC.3